MRLMNTTVALGLLIYPKEEENLTSLAMAALDSRNRRWLTWLSLSVSRHGEKPNPLKSIINQALT